MGHLPSLCDELLGDPQGQVSPEVIDFDDLIIQPTPTYEELLQENENLKSENIELKLQNENLQAIIQVKNE